MIIEIFDEVSCLQIVMDGAIIPVQKEHIKAIEIVNNRILINTGADRSGHIYMDYADVATPGSHHIYELQALLVTMMSSRENVQTALLSAVVTELDEIKMILNGTNDYFKEPQFIDQPFPGITYKGFSSTINADGAQPVWAIQEIKQSGGLTSLRWADGRKDFDKVWDDRAFYAY